MTAIDIIYRSAKSIAQSIRDREVSSVEVVQAHLDRIGEVNERLNAVVALCTERALSEARDADAAIARGDSVGPLHGVPMTLKDSLDTEGRHHNRRNAGASELHAGARFHRRRPAARRGRDSVGQD